MDKKYYNLKNKFRLRFRIRLLTTLILLILGFIFFPKDEIRETSPKIRRNTEYLKKPQDNIEETEHDHNKKDTLSYYFRGPHERPPEPLNINKLNFHYPENLRTSGIEGTVCLELWIDKEGDVKDIRVIRSIHPDLDKIAVENAWKIKFSPCMQDGKPVGVPYSFSIEFKLE